MKVILLKDVPKVGKRYETKNVADGFALNFLIPQKLGEIASAAAVKRVELERARDTAERKVHEDLLIKNLKNIDGATVTIKGRANEKGHLFAGIHTGEIVPEITAQTRVQINPEFIVLEKPIKEVGEYDIEIKVQNKSAKFKLVVVAQ
jgi:large subunit ribosomal protein L9